MQQDTDEGVHTHHIRADYVKDALEWLKENNFEYRDIEISSEHLEELRK